MQIGSYQLKNRVWLAPMAGITDQPFRKLCAHYQAGLTFSEMMSTNPQVWHTEKSKLRLAHHQDIGINAVQIAGSDPAEMAQAARINVEYGAQIIDINMGCPAKKVCNVLAGSALLQNEKLVAEILNSVVNAVDVPVTLKTRLGWDDNHKNIVTIANLAEQAGIAALAIHGRTRTQMYRGIAEYDLIAQVKQTVRLPIWVNGDIDSPQKAAAVLTQTGADGVMIGRAAQGQPWLFSDIAYYLEHATLPPRLPFQAACSTILSHLAAIHEFYGEISGVRIARKHIAWYLQRLPVDTNMIRKMINNSVQADEQYQLLAEFLSRQELDYFPRNYD